MNNIYFIIIALLFLVYMIIEVRKGKLAIKESFWWVMCSLLMLFLSIFPYSINWIASVFNVEYPPSLLFVFCILFLLFKNFKNSKRISEHEMKIIDLAQEVSILRSELDEKRKKQS